MTGQATFGDFARAARRQLTAGPSRAGHTSAAVRVGEVDEFIQAMHRLVTVMARYCDDVAAVFPGSAQRGGQYVPGSWPYASAKAREAIQNAAGFLRLGEGETGESGHPRAAGPAAAAVDAAAVSLRAGRDLLHTHVTARPDGARAERSGWASVTSSQRVARALLLQVGMWGRLAATRGARLALSAPPRCGTEQARWNLNAACQWLWVLDSAVQAAQRHDPVTATDVALLAAVPVNAPTPRRLPDGAETAAELCQGAIGCAERVRHIARAAVPDARWSPALTADSLRHTAACGTVISHHCAILLRCLATRAGQHGAAGLSDRLLGCADAAADARASWLRAARSWSRVTTDTRGTIAPIGAETADLALWTGRLAYTDPAWTPAQGPSETVRPPEILSPEPEDLPRVVAAVHEACQTLTEIAAGDHEQIRAAAQARRLLVSTRSLSAAFDIPQPFTYAPSDRVNGLLAVYHEARAASEKATAAVATVAAEVRAPSHILTLARAAIQGDAEPTGEDSRLPAESVPAAREFPGPVERILQDLGVTSPEQLRRAVAVDQAGEQLILEAARDVEPGHTAMGDTSFGKSAPVAELINHMLASGSPSAVARLRPPPPRAARPTVPDPARARQAGYYSMRSAPEAEAEP